MSEVTSLVELEQQLQEAEREYATAAERLTHLVPSPDVADGSAPMFAPGYSETVDAVRTAEARLSQARNAFHARRMFELGY